MPKLNLLDCSIELGPNNIKITEYGTRYSDGYVETFIAVPDSKIPFSVHLKSNGYIAPGLAFFVYIDGEYQCNRNRIGLKIPASGVQANEYETEFRVRQKEEKTSSGTFVVRDWTFAKLDKVTADKAPNVNPRFTSNVGTIEVVVLRCHTDQDDVPPPRATPKRAGNAEQVEKKASSFVKPPSKPASSKKAASVQENEPDGMLGGLFGIFDGSCDTVGFDGPADGKPVGADGRVKIIAPPNMTWDSEIGTWVPSPHSCPTPDIRRQQIGFSLFARPSQIHIFQEAAESDEAWLDGLDERGGQPEVVANQWGSRRQMNGHGNNYEYYPPMNVPARTYGRRFDPQQVDQYQYRPQLQNRTYFSHGRLPALSSEQAYAQSAPEGTHPKPKLIAEELQNASAALDEYIHENPTGDYIKDARRDFDTIRRLQTLQQRGGETLMYFPPWLLEVLRDIEIRRQYILSLKNAYPYVDFSDMLEKSTDELKTALPDLLLHKHYHIGVRKDALALLHVYSERVGTMTSFLDLTEDYPRVPADEVRARVEFLRMEQEKIQRSLEMFAPNEHPAHHPRQPQWAGYQGGDGAFNNPRGSKHGGWATEPRNDADVAGWEKVGEATWKPDQDRGDGHKCKGDNDRRSSKGSDRGDKQKNERGRDGWGEKSAASQKTHEHAFSEAKSKTDQRSTRSQKSRSSHHSHQNNGWADDSGNQQQNQDQTWDNNNDNQQQPDNKGWDTSGDAKNTDQNGWDGNSEKKSRAPSIHSKAKSSSEYPEPKIKPYWKEWNMPLTQDSAAHANAQQHRKEPRPVYNYTPSPLPAVPADKAKDASHGVQIGKGADYSHKCRKPVYMDTMDQPYAVFSFKYRSKEALEKILKLKIDDVDVKRIEEEIEKDRLNMLPKHKLVEELMEKRGSPPESSPRSGKRSGEDKAGGKDGKDNAGWGSGGDYKSSWEGQSNKSKSSHQSGSKHSGGQRKRSQNGGADGWSNDDGGNAGAGEGNGFTGW